MGATWFERDLDRRVFVKGVGSVGLGVVFGTLFGGCESLVEQIRNRPTRRRLRAGSSAVDQAVATYADAVAAMKALPAGDPRSWLAQAAIHGGPSGFNHCQHGTPHFFSWHRAYLLYFERICQELSGDPTFGLPYWNWNQNPVIHSAFTNAASTLFHQRDNTSLSGVPAISSTTLDTILADSNFFTFGAQLEGSPHNIVHVVVGGEMGGGASARDPLFWTHHCMVDYAWAKWNIELDNDNPNDQAWLDTEWDHFVDGQGNQASTTAGLTTLMPLLSYQYESSAVGSSPAADAVRAGEDFDRLERRIRAGADVRFDVKQRYAVAERASLPLAGALSRTANASANTFARLLDSERPDETVFASIEYTELPTTSDFFVRVFVDLPSANAATPTSDPHYAGSFAFFGTRGGDQHGEHAHHHRPRFLVDVTPTLRALRRRGALADQNLSLQLVPVPLGETFAERGAALELARFELLVTPVRVRDR